MNRLIAMGIIASILALVSNTSVVSQNINISTPFQSVGSSQFENFGVNFGWGQGGANSPLGLSNPNSGGQLSFGGNGFRVGFNFAKGSSRSSVTNAPSLTVQNGFGGDMFSGSFRPFVNGYIPIVGSEGVLLPPPIDNAVTRAVESGQLDLHSRLPATESIPSPPNGPLYNDVESSATHAVRSVAAIKAERARTLAIKEQNLNKKLQEARELLADGNGVAARTEFRAAIQLTDDAATKKAIKAEIKASYPSHNEN